MLKHPLPAVHDPEGDGVFDSFPPVVDAHVHIFPDELFESIWQWFDRFAWPIRYRLGATDALEFLQSRGIHHVVALQYAHRPGVASGLNAHMAGLCNRYPWVTGMAAVFPGEDGAERVMEHAFSSGLGGVKLHAHVQCFDMESPEMHEIYQVCSEHRKPLVMHVGREPRSPAYDCDPHQLCKASKLEKVIKAYPGLRVCVPHLGADEYEAYGRMLESYDNLWLDTTMTLADYLPGRPPPPLTQLRLDRIMYGSDFPNLPYAWDRELKRMGELGLSGRELSLVLSENAMEFFSIQEGT